MSFKAAILSDISDTPDSESKTILPLCASVSLMTSTMALGSSCVSNDHGSAGRGCWTELRLQLVECLNEAICGVSFGIFYT